MLSEGGKKIVTTDSGLDSSEEVANYFSEKHASSIVDRAEERLYITSVFEVGQTKDRFKIPKMDIPVVRVEYSQGEEAVVIVENGHSRHQLTLPWFSSDNVWLLADYCARFVEENKPAEPSQLLKTAERLRENLKGNLQSEQEIEIISTPISRYLPHNPEAPINEGNLITIDQLIAKEAARPPEKKQAGTDVDQSDEELYLIEVGGETFHFLRSGEMYFLMENEPTINLLNAAIREGIILPEEAKRYTDIQTETQLREETKQQYLEMGEQTGAEKDLRKDNFWADSPAIYGYDAVRRLNYLEIGGEPVMDEFEKEYIRLLGKNAARYDSVVLEVGFGMGLSANAVMEELERQQELGADPTYIIIELNKDAAALAREWGKRQKVPVIVLEGDWQDQIKQIPDELITGAIVDPYPLSPDEKHEDAARPLREIIKKLRPGGVVSYYPDSQYCLSDRHAQLAREAGFKYIGSATANFGGQNTAEYYLMSHMALPVLYKEGGTAPDRWDKVEAAGPELKRKILREIFIEDTKSAEAYFLKRKWQYGTTAK
jgi:SAM-dependent methyltransferase